MKVPLSVAEGRLGSSCPKKVTEHIWLAMFKQVDKRLA